MDRQALRFIAMLENDEKDEHGEDKIDIQLKMKVFQMGQDWLIRRKKLRPDTGNDDEGDGVREMREWINAPEGKRALEAMIFDMGFVKAPTKKNGRPTREEAVVRRRFKEHNEAQQVESDRNDDSGLQALLGGDE